MSDISVITSEIFVAYLQCPRKAFLLLHSEDKGKHHDYPLILKELRQHNRNQYLKKFLKSHPEAKDYDVKTFKYSGFLVNAKLRSEKSEAYCAVLTKANNSQEYPQIRYEPTIAAGTYSITFEQKIELLFVALVLGRLQKQIPSVGRIVSMDGKAHRVKLENRYESIKESLKTLEDWCTTRPTESPPLILNKHCVCCQFRGSCRQQAEQENNLSLLPKFCPN